MKNVRKLPIVGDVHLSREQWPSTPTDWHNLWNIATVPAKLTKISYAVNEHAKAFSAFNLHFLDQKFPSYDLSATDNDQRKSATVRYRQPIQ